MATHCRPSLLAVIRVIIGLAILVSVQAAKAERWQLVISAAKPGTAEVPVLVEASPSLPMGDYLLERSGVSETIIAQVFNEQGKRWLGSVLPLSSVPGTYTLRPRSVSDSAVSAGFKLVPRNRNIVIQIDGTPFSEYRIDTGAKPYLFPVVGPTGDSYTRAYPMEMVDGEDHDHPHQRSFWFTHGKVNEVDFWSEQGKHGTIKEAVRRSVVSGPVLGRLCTTDEWIGPDGAKVCDDERALTFYRTKNARVIDFEIAIKATAGPVTFGDTKEGMFGLRVASSMDVDKKRGGRIVNAEGLTDARAWGKASAWVDYSGPIKGKTVGIAILNHPRSFRFPTTWHVRTYGLFAANPFGWHDFGMNHPGDYTLPAGEKLVFAYRVILHEGDASSARIADTFDRYAHPLKIVVTEN